MFRCYSCLGIALGKGMREEEVLWHFEGGRGLFTWIEMVLLSTLLPREPRVKSLILRVLRYFLFLFLS